MSNLPRLADLLRARNTVESNVANLLERPMTLGAVGDYIAAEIFGITLVQSTSHTEFAGIFSDPELAGKTVDIQWYPRREGNIHVHTEPVPDYYLILAGPKPEASTAHSLTSPWLIHSVHLFKSQDLLIALRERGVQIGTRTSVITQLWERAEIYPEAHNHELHLTEEQCQFLKLFH